MPIRCECLACNAQFQVDSKHAGRKARCPKCQEVLVVPQDVPKRAAAPPRRSDSNIHGGESSGTEAKQSPVSHSVQEPAKQRLQQAGAEAKQSPVSHSIQESAEQ